MNIEGGGSYIVTPAILQFLSYDQEEVYGHRSNLNRVGTRRHKSHSNRCSLDRMRPDPMSQAQARF